MARQFLKNMLSPSIIGVLLLSLASGIFFLFIGLWLSVEKANEQLVSTIDQMFLMTEQPATRAGTSLDTSLAEEVANSILMNEFVQSVRILDDQDDILAESNRNLPSPSSSYTFFLHSYIGAETVEYTHELPLPANLDGDALIEITVSKAHGIIAIGKPNPKLLAIAFMAGSLLIIALSLMIAAIRRGIIVPPSQKRIRQKAI